MDSNQLPSTNNSTTIITIIIGPPPPPPPFLPPPSTPRSIDLSALEFILALISIISIPALIYTFLFAIKCSPFNRSTHHNNHSSSTLDQASDTTTTTTSDIIITELPSNDGTVKFKREAHVKEMGTTECPVCLSVFLDGEDIRQLSACEHAFHSACIDMWLTSHSSCPICRAFVVNNNRNKKLRSNNTNTDRRMSAVRYVYDDDHHQGLPDASSLV